MDEVLEHLELARRSLNECDEREPEHAVLDALCEAVDGLARQVQALVAGVEGNNADIENIRASLKSPPAISEAAATAPAAKPKKAGSARTRGRKW